MKQSIVLTKQLRKVAEKKKLNQKQIANLAFFAHTTTNGHFNGYPVPAESAMSYNELFNDSELAFHLGQEFLGLIGLATGCKVKKDPLALVALIGREERQRERLEAEKEIDCLLLPGTFGAEGKECITISKSGLGLSGPVVRRLNKPEWVQLYLDESRLALFVIPCEATDEGARSCVNPKSNRKAGYRKSWSGSILEKVAKASGMDIENYRYHVEPEEVEGYPTALGFDLTKAVKING